MCNLLPLVRRFVHTGVTSGPGQGRYSCGTMAGSVEEHRGGGAPGQRNPVGERVRRRREEAGLKQEIAAHRIGRSRRWLIDLEAGRGDPTLSDLLALASVLHVDLDWLLGDVLGGQGRVNHVPGTGKLEPEEDEDTKRRQFVQCLLAIMAGAGVLDAQRLIAGPKDPLGVDAQLLDDLEAFTRSFMARRHTSPPRVLLYLVDGHLKALSNLLDRSASLRLYGLTSETAWLAGWLAYRADRRVQALAYASFAETLALEANDGPRRALALLLRAHLHSSIPRGGQLGNTPLALAALNEAETSAGRGASSLMRTELLARRAEEHAVAGDRRAAESDLDASVRELARGGDDALFGHWNLGLIAGFKGHCLHLLHQPQAAADLLQQAVEHMDPALNRSVAVADLGAAYADANDIDHACDQLHHALNLAEQAGLTFAVQRIRGIRAQHLAGHIDSPVVRQLDDRLGLIA